MVQELCRSIFTLNDRMSRNISINTVALRGDAPPTNARSSDHQINQQFAYMTEFGRARLSYEFRPSNTLRFIRSGEVET